MRQEVRDGVSVVMKKNALNRWWPMALLACMLTAFFLLASASCGKPTVNELVSDADSSPQTSAEHHGITINEADLELGKGITHQLSASGGEKIRWSSSDASVANVDDNGLVKGLGVGTCVLKAENEYGSAAECHVSVKKTCYLTIDDGPTEHTRDILAALKENDVKATFFVMYSRYLPLTADMYAQGHEVAFHTYSHEYNICYRSRYGYFADLEIMGDIVEGYTGRRPNLIRFPGGTSNSAGNALIMRQLVNGADDLGYRIFDWTATAGDTSPKATSPDFTAYSILKTCTEDEEIVLMHDKWLTPDSLRKVIPSLRERGYVFETLNHYPENSYRWYCKYSISHEDLPAESVSLNETHIEMAVGEKYILEAQCEPENTTDYIRWESADASVAAVKADGTVIAVKPGTAEIAAITTSGQSAVCVVTVKSA